MQLFTCISLLLTVVVGSEAFRAESPSADLMKLLYAYLALTTIVCALVSLAARKPAGEAAEAVIEARKPERARVKR